MDRTDGAARVIRNGSMPRKLKGAKKGRLDSRGRSSARLREERRKTREPSRPR